MIKKNVFRYTCIAIILFVTVLFFFNTVKVNGSDLKPEYKIVTVEKGDTLWGIAKKNCSNYNDIRKAVYDIKKANNITSASISPGQEIRIPSKLYK